MATLVLSAVGAAVGSALGGTLLGLSGAVIGRALGATLGRVIDQRLMGTGSEVVQTGRIERFRVMGASEGAPIGQVFGRVRISGQVIWATRFAETVSTTEAGGKGGSSSSTTVESYSYSVSLAIALCEGEILKVGRVWADGNEIRRRSLNMRVYRGSETQLPDPKIEAVQGAGKAPAYRGTAYVVLEDLQLGRFGNRVPQFSFEVIRPAQGSHSRSVTDLPAAIHGVALMPGTGEYALATTPVHYSDGPGANRTANVHFQSGRTDFSTSLSHLRSELPQCQSVSLIVSWFGDDLRCGSCKVKPKVEQKEIDGTGMAWRSGGIGRASADLVPKPDGRSIYGGTPADQSVIDAIRAIRDGGQDAMFYPFLLMDQLEGNTLPNPWTGQPGQPALPWRGRISLSLAPGLAGSPDRTATAEAEVATFFGIAQPNDFQRAGDTVSYSGPVGWGYRRFILHYAHLCKAAGGVEAFCIGSEMRSLTQARGAGNTYPAVAALRQLAQDVRGILGPAVKISYAADWTEYFGHHDAEGSVFFHLDPLWSDPDIDFVGIDNYMPISDWRDGEDHADVHRRTIYDLDYLKSNIAGGEGFDWYYDSAEAAALQVRRPIMDGAASEPWVFRYKDLVGWWSSPHHDRPSGVRSATPTAWVPQSKPIRFTEYGCAAIDKGTNEPNKFLDPKSSESAVPRFSTGRRDDLIQMQYLRAMADHWTNPENNPLSPVFGDRMVDFARSHVWAWDARPFPVFPNLRSVWSDGQSYGTGHWLNGRSTNQVLGSVVADICERSGATDFDVSRLHGLVRGYAINDVDTARAALQSLMLAYGFDAVERDGLLRFLNRDARVLEVLAVERLASMSELAGAFEAVRAAEVEMVGRVRLAYVDAQGGFETRQSETVFPDDTSLSVSQSELPLCLTSSEARGIVERWLAEARVARETIRLALPKSLQHIGAGDVFEMEGTRYRVDRIEQTESQRIEAVRVEPANYLPTEGADAGQEYRPPPPSVPVHAVFLDLPLLEGTEVPHAPHLAVTASPWQGPVAIWSAPSDAGYVLNRTLRFPSVIGTTESPLAGARSGLLDKGQPLRVKVFGGALSSAELLAVLNGANAAAIGDGSPETWEVFQFTSAQLVAPQTYELGGRLRGQAGTDSVMPRSWPVGSTVVLLGKGPEQIKLSMGERGLARHFRIGLADLGYDDPASLYRVEAFSGIGLRPYAPVHLRALAGPAGDWQLAWVRRTRVDGDGWQVSDVPIGEVSEQYIVRVFAGANVVREATTEAPAWTYSAAARAADGTTAGCRISVAQVSDRFEPGLFRTIDLPA